MHKDGQVGNSHREKATNIRMTKRKLRLSSTASNKAQSRGLLPSGALDAHPIEEDDVVTRWTRTIKGEEHLMEACFSLYPKYLRLDTRGLLTWALPFG